MKLKAWACMWAAILITAGAWAGGDDPAKDKSTVIIEPEDIEEILESVHDALDDARKEMRDTDRGRDRKSTRLNSSHIQKSRMPSSA